MFVKRTESSLGPLIKIKASALHPLTVAAINPTGTMAWYESNTPYRRRGGLAAFDDWPKLDAALLRRSFPAGHRASPEIHSMASTLLRVFAPTATPWSAMRWDPCKATCRGFLLSPIARVAPPSRSPGASLFPIRKCLAYP